MIKRAAPALLAAGGVVAVASVVVGLPLFGARPYALVPLIVGALAVAVGAAFPQGETRAPALRRAWRWLVVVAVLAAGWGVARVVDVTHDVTRARVNSLAEESVAVARGLNDRVRIVSFLEPGDRADVELEALVERYRRESPYLRFERASPKSADGAALARALGVAELLPLGGPNVVVVVDRDRAQPVRLRFEAGAPTQEEQLTNALLQATSTATKTTVWVLSGHGEPDVRDDGAFGLAQLRTALLARGIELVPLPQAALADARLLAQGKAVVVPPSTTPLSPEETTAVRAYVENGGAALVLAEPEPTALQQAVAGVVGVTVVPDVVVEEGAFAALAGADTVTGSSQMAHAVTRPLRGALTHFPRTAALALAPIDGVTVTPLVSTSGEAKLQKTQANGPLPLVVAAVVGGGARVIVAGDATFAENAGVGLGANRDLAVNAVLWLVEDEHHIAVRPRAKTGALLFLTPSSRERLAFVLLFLIPVTLAAAGAVRHARRR